MTRSVSSLRREASNSRKRARRQGLAAITRLQRDRLADIVGYAREQSPYYARLYRGLPDRVADPTLLPVTDKKTLMGHFDDWVTDREIRLADVTAYVDDPDLIGRRFLGRYLAATTSGTTGHRGLFILDDRCQNVAAALGAVTY